MRPDAFGYKSRRGDSEREDDPVPAVGSYLEVPEADIEDRIGGTQGGIPNTPATGMSTDGKSEPPGNPASARRASRLSNIRADRPIFTLSVAADLLGLHPRTLRIYEEKRLVVPARTEGNRRRYSQNDIQRFQFIRRLTQGGVNLEGVRIILDMAQELAEHGGNPEEVIERNLNTLNSL